MSQTSAAPLDLRHPQLVPRLRARLYWGLLLLFPGVLLGWEFMPAVLSMSMMALLALGLWQGLTQGDDAHSGRPPLWRLWLRLRAVEWPWWAITLLVWMLVPSFFYSENLGEWAGRLRIKLPLLALPLAFALMPRLETKHLHSLYGLLIGLMVLANLGVGLYYAAHFEAIQATLFASKSVPTPIHHIRFSLLSGIAVLAGLEILRARGRSLPRLFVVAVAAATLFLFLMVHILAVRTGMLALYAGLLAWGTMAAWNARRYAWALATIALVVLAPILAYQFLPSVRAKIGLMRWNLEQYRAGHIGEYSDTQRWVSYDVGLAIGNRSPIWGCGLGDLKDEIARKYAEAYPGAKPMLPHNQWLFFYAGAGLLGVVFFALAFFGPIFYQKKYREPLFLSINVVLFVSFLTETTLETAVGVAVYAFFVCLGLSGRIPK